MATFQIHEDLQNVVENKRQDSKKNMLALEISKKRSLYARSAFQTINNVIKEDTKRIKISSQLNESVRVISIQTVQEENKESVKEKNADILNLECIRLSSEKDVVPIKIINKNYEENRCLSFELMYNHEYRHDIWAYLKQIEIDYKWPNPNYMKKQTHLDADMRSILVDWLAAVSDDYKLSQETFHLSINYIDRFLSKMSVVRDKFQLLGSVAMMIAGKIEEIYPPNTKEWAYVSCNTYTTHQITKMELLLLKVLKFDLQPPTIPSFIKLICSEHNLDEKTLYLAMYLSELVLLEGEEYLEHLPSKLAAASIALARVTLSKSHPWPKRLETSSGYTLKQLSPVVERQNKSFKDSPSKTQQNIQTKYSSNKYHKVALLKPKSLNTVLFKNQ